jgi:Ca2+-transporting ATPase
MDVTGIHPSDGRSIIYIKGSIEAVLDRCQFYFVSESSTPGLDTATRSMILERATSVASRGLRVLAMAYGYGNFDTTHPPNSHNLIFTGFQAMYDPPRPGVKEAISKLHAGGVKVIMITGDAEHTALAIAKELGLKVPGGRGSCLTGTEMDAMTEREVGDRIARGVSVFARVTPRHKMVIVGALQSRGDVVGMTGDGVNDAPALKLADIGTSMGKSGTDVAKEAADVILVDDNFATLLSAVEEGKQSFFHALGPFLNSKGRKINIPQHSKLPVVPTEYGGCSTDSDHTQHGVPP